MKQYLHGLFKITLCIISALSLCACGVVSERTADTSTEFVLDTFCTVTVTGGGASVISDAFAEARRIQKNIDFYDSDSTVSRFNNAPKGEPVALDGDTFAIVKLALEISERSGGAFDITVAPVSQLWDFKSDSPVPPDSKPILTALEYVGYKNLVLNESAKTLTKLKDGVKIDLGACGKGYACEKILSGIAENHPNSYVIIDFGGNIGVYGSNPKHKDGRTTVGIQEPFAETGRYSQTAAIYSGQSAVTSGTYQRHFYYNSKNYHHLLDPKTGYPAETGPQSVTIISDSSLLADCLSTACFVLGRDKGGALAESFGAQIIWID